jgi:hypothetical protein
LLAFKVSAAALMVLQSKVSLQNLSAYPTDTYIN